MDAWRFLPLETKRGVENMAIDEAILNARIAKQVPNTLRLYRWDPSTASIGRNQSLNEEVDVEVAHKSGVDVVRRISGGGAVLHDRDREITYSVILAESDFRAQFGELKNVEVFHKITEGIVKALNKLSIQPDQGVIHCPAIFIQGKKISGNAQARQKGVILQHGTILLDVDAELMYSILKTPQGVPKARMVRSVRAKVTGIQQFIPNFDVHLLGKFLKEGFEEAFGITLTTGELSPWELQEADRLARERYGNLTWTNRLS